MTRSDFFCNTCGRVKIELGGRVHRCPPNWAVHLVDDPPSIRRVYADDPADAAIKYAEQVGSDSLSCYGEAPPTLSFTVYGSNDSYQVDVRAELVVQYTAEIVSHTIGVEEEV